MSSGTRADVASVRPVIAAMGKTGQQRDTEQALDVSARAGLSPRQRELDRLWRYYRCATYDGHKIDWDGRERPNPEEADQIVQAQFIPPGFYMSGQNQAPLPLRYRRPTAPYYLVRVVVDRFTSLLFSSHKHPKLVVPDDENTEDWLIAVSERARLWSVLAQARTFGGAMGSVGLGFKFVDGELQFEVHDPRWVTPTFEYEPGGTVTQIEKRFMYPDWIRDPLSGTWVEGHFWYRRVIDKNSDTVWPKVPVEDGLEPLWASERSVTVVHGFGFCPVVWIHNKPVHDDVDGDSDCHGVYDLVEAIDSLTSQANRGVLANCDPTLKISSDLDMPASLLKGSGNAVKVEKGGDASYMEISGSGPKAALELAEKLEDKALTITRCYLEKQNEQRAYAVTATEVDRRYSSMLEQADVLREQYGEKGVKRLLGMVLTAARRIGSARVVEQDPSGIMPPRIIRSAVLVPPRVKDGQRMERRVGDGRIIELRWPEYFRPALDDVLNAVQSAVAARAGQLVDTKHAIQFIASYFQIENVQSVIEELEKERAEQDRIMQGGVQAGVPTPHEGMSTTFAGGQQVDKKKMSSPVAISGDVAAGKLNGAQVTALLGILTRVEQGSLTHIAGAELLIASFGFAPDQANRLVEQGVEGTKGVLGSGV